MPSIPPAVTSRILKKLEEIREILISDGLDLRDFASWRLSDPQVELSLTACAVRYGPTTTQTPMALPILSVPRDPSPCELAILAVLSDSQPMTTTQVLGALADAGEIHGESTVKTTLARMVREGKLVNEGRGGYSLA